MPNDYGSLVTEIENELTRGTSLTSLVQASIQEAIKHYEGRMFWFNQERATASTVASQEYYDLPSDFRKMHWLFVLASDGTYSTELAQETIPTIENTYLSTFTGEPYCFAVWREEYRLFPIPDAVYTLRLFYIKTFATLSATTDTNAWMVEGKNLVKYRAKYLLYMNKIRDQKMAEAMKILEQEALDDLNRTTAQIVQKPMLNIPSQMPTSSGSFDYRRGY